jgi:hypothetical protein
MRFGLLRKVSGRKLPGRVAGTFTIHLGKNEENRRYK